MEGDNASSSHNGKTTSQSKNGNSTTKTMSKNNKKRKSPFRIRCGNLVVTRRPTVPTHWMAVFVPPPPAMTVWDHNNNGMSLVGVRVRCQVVHQAATIGDSVGPEEDGRAKNNKATKKRVVEGLIVKVISGLSSPGVVVELLLDDADQVAAAVAMGLPRLDPNTAAAVSTKKNGVHNKTSSSSEQRYLELERKIQGIDTAVVQVTLVPGKWAIQTYVPPKQWAEETAAAEGLQRLQEKQKSNGEELHDEVNEGSHKRTIDAIKPKRKRQKTVLLSSLYIGDGHDSEGQQINNWRFLAGRFARVWNIGQVVSIDTKTQPTLSTTVTTTTISSSTSLASVTVRPMLWPEQTKDGRQSFHRSNEVFVDADAWSSCACGSSSLDSNNGSSNNSNKYAIETLIQVARHVVAERPEDVSDENGHHDDDRVVATLQYSRRHNLFAPIGVVIDPNQPHCHRCRVQEGGPVQQQQQQQRLHQCGESSCRNFWCSSCISQCSGGSNGSGGLDGGGGGGDAAAAAAILPCCTKDATATSTTTNGAASAGAGAGSCDCSHCREQRELAARFAFRGQILAHADAVSALQSIQTPVAFRLPPHFLDPWPLPSRKPCTKLLLPGKKHHRATTTTTKNAADPSKSSRTTKKNGKRTDRRKKRPRAAEPTVLQQDEDDEDDEPPEDYSFFQPACARIDDPSPKQLRRRRRYRSNKNDPSAAAEKPRNARDLQISRLLTEQSAPSRATKQSSRAMRWNQRRLEQVVGRTNALASKEAFLRFGRSSIHAWGVFAEKPIEAEELIIEYRGELIGNAVAERREVEYARSLGRDYMFRIDAEQVCDATKQGNVARFINASCEPNCYTKVITFDGAKRIVIYAKRDISEGEELTYDYKFEPEYDPAKRIPCNCMAKECRGFMNWDRRYVDIPVVAAPNDVTPDDTSLEQSSEGGEEVVVGLSSSLMRQASASAMSPKARIQR